MNILVVSYVDCITNRIKELVEKEYKEVNIDVVKDAANARYNSSVVNYDLVIIDMRIQQYDGEIIKPILIPATLFLKDLKKRFPLTKVFALFDEGETGKKGQDEITALGYEIAAYDYLSIEWETKLLQYI